MRRSVFIGIVGLLAGAVSWAGTPATGPVVVELFESQGCSSCPPAESLMKELQQKYGSGVILLTFHVDYWDNLGWKDTFSDARYTERQRFYAEAFNQSSMYTPEMVVQGESGFVGSDGRQAQSEINSRLAQARPLFTLTAHSTSGGSHTVDIQVQLPAELARATQRLTVVLYENAPSVKVLRGENRGETMGGDFAVRDIKEMPAPQNGHSSINLSLQNISDPTHAGIVVLVQGSIPQ